jgi:hypothetical protein
MQRCWCTQPRWPQDSTGTGHTKKYITDGTSTYKAEPRGPKSRIEYKNGIAVQQVPLRDDPPEDGRMRPKRYILTDIRQAKQLFSSKIERRNACEYEGDEIIT